MDAKPNGVDRQNGLDGGAPPPPHDQPSPADPAAESGPIGLGRIRVARAPHDTGIPIDDALIASVRHLPDGELFVATHHRNLFQSRYGSAMAILREQLATANACIPLKARRLAIAMGHLAGLQEIRMTAQPNAADVPWTRADRLKWTTLLLVSIALLGIGVNTLAVYLIGSGLVVFARQHFLAYILSCVNLAISFALKSTARLLSDRGRRRYGLVLSTFGIACGAIWIVTFACLFGHLSMPSLEELVKAMKIGSTSSRVVLENVFVGTQLFAEIAIAAALWLHMEDIAAGHRAKWVADENPEYQAYERLGRTLSDELQTDRQTRGRVEGELQAYRALESAFVTRARARWIKEAGAPND